MEQSLKLICEEFEDMEEIPVTYTCEGEDINPILEFQGIPESTKSLVIIVDDPDTKPITGFVFNHWIIVNISPETTLIQKNSVPEEATILKNSNGENRYLGPCPPDEKTHRYFFKLYALDTILDVNHNTTKEELLEMMKDHIIDHNELVGVYKKKYE